MNQSKSTTTRLVLSALLIGLSAVLSMVKIWQMPLGGSVTLLSMLPVMLISIKYGPKWGLFCSFVYALTQIGLDLSGLMTWGMTAKIWIGCLVFDYIVAFTALGLAGIFRKKGTSGICAGILLAILCRFVSHFVSGSIFFDIWCPDDWNVYLYSVCYNGAYLLPELIFTMIGAVILFKVPQTRRLLSVEAAVKEEKAPENV